MELIAISAIAAGTTATTTTAAVATTAAATTAATSLTIGSVMTGASALAGIASGVMAYQAGQASQEQEELQASQTELQGRFDAIQTNEELLKTLSKNKVAAVSAGLAGSGSVLRAKEASQKKAAEELSVNRYNTEAKAAAHRAAGRSSAGKGLLSGIGSVITSGETVSKALKIKKETVG